MAILNMGSVNIDTVFRVARMPAPGETLAARDIAVGLGGKGLNQSVAIARAGGRAVHLGCVGEAALRARIEDFGVDVTHLHVVAQPTGQAAILVDAGGENAIVLARGANGAITPGMIAGGVAAMAPGDWLLVQNETNGVAGAVAAAKAAGLRVALSPAPFDAEVVLPLLGQADLICLNEIELEQLRAAGGRMPPDILCVVTLGARGARAMRGAEVVEVPARRVKAVDTTGAGDTFLGYLLATLEDGADLRGALDRAVAAAALQVTRAGAAEAIPTAAEVAAFQASGRDDAVSAGIS